jgi:hypothetical protein
MAACVKILPCILISKNAHPSNFYSKTKRPTSFVQETKEKINPVLPSVYTGILSSGDRNLDSEIFSCHTFSLFGVFFMVSVFLVSESFLVSPKIDFGRFTVINFLFKSAASYDLGLEPGLPQRRRKTQDVKSYRTVYYDVCVCVLAKWRHV